MKYKTLRDSLTVIVGFLYQNKSFSDDLVILQIPDGGGLTILPVIDFMSKTSSKKDLPKELLPEVNLIVNNLMDEVILPNLEYGHDLVIRFEKGGSKGYLLAGSLRREVLTFSVNEDLSVRVNYRRDISTMRIRQPLDYGCLNIQVLCTKVLVRALANAISVMEPNILTSYECILHDKLVPLKLEIPQYLADAIYEQAYEFLWSTPNLNTRKLVVNKADSVTFEIYNGGQLMGEFLNE